MSLKRQNFALLQKEKQGDISMNCIFSHWTNGLSVQGTKKAMRANYWHILQTIFLYLCLSIFVFVAFHLMQQQQPSTTVNAFKPGCLQGIKFENSWETHQQNLAKNRKPFMNVWTKHENKQV